MTDNISGNTAGGTARLFRSPAGKVGTILGLLLLMQIPLMMVDGLIGEREARQGEVLAGFRRGWGPEQTVAGPVLVVPSPQATVDVVGAPATTVGGAFAGARNVISGNSASGVDITGAGTSSNIVMENEIGTNAVGTVAVANPIGVLIEQGASGNIIGGTEMAARNILSGNFSAGVELTGTDTSGNVVGGNFIGTSASGASPVSNGTGVLISNAATMKVLVYFILLNSLDVAVRA